ncbi:MAG: Wzz/FepE/Etk N-terminal domain-containing protein [Bacteroidales bacterium]|nr:Wzz/FepE/Etk N-terminal domain-containing protein [Bacteroidales bacterium]MDT8432247.1 Wzz/FepE/Etk N-terminal domain-containing protein [Bacteroidales bacterium]
MNNNAQKGVNFSSVDLLIYMWKKRWILIIVTFLAGVTSIIVSLQITEKYESTVVMFPTTGASISKSLLSANYQGRQSVYGFGEEEQAEQLLQVLNSEQIRGRIIEKYNLMEHYGIDPESKYPYTKLANQYTDNISFRRTELMSVEISVMDTDPQVAADIANDISDLIDTVYNEMKQARALAAFELVKKEYIEAQLDVRILRDSLETVGEDMSASLRMAGGTSLAFLARALATHGGTFITLTNHLDHETERLADLRQRYQEARVEAEQELPHKFIVDRAYASEKKAYPKRSVIVMVSAAAAFLFTLILLVIVDSLKERTVMTRED